MTTNNPQLFADAEDVWYEDAPGKRGGMAWDEVYAVSGSKLDVIDAIYTSVVLDFEYGEFMELYDIWLGFEQVVAAITARLPGINPHWFEQVQRLGVDAPPLTVWQCA